MKKTINVTIDEADWQWLKKRQTNISAWIRALIVKKHNEDAVNILAEKDIKEVFDGKRDKDTER